MGVYSVTLSSIVIASSTEGQKATQMEADLFFTLPQPLIGISILYYILPNNIFYFEFEFEKCFHAHKEEHDYIGLSKSMSFPPFTSSLPYFLGFSDKIWSVLGL